MNVYNLSEMTRPAAESLLLAKEGRLCVRYWQRADGTILTRNCPVGLAALRAKAARAVMRIAAVLGLLVSGGALLGSRTRNDSTRLSDTQPFATLVRWLDPAAQSQRSGQFLMGDVCIPMPPSSPSSVAPR
jgi:hypothetical protein